MITEDFVSFEVAKLLKEKGFNEPCNGRYSYRGGNVVVENYPITNESLKYHPNIDGISAPTYQMAMKWLREVHKLAFIISPQWAEGDMRNPCRWYWEIRGLEDIGLDVYSNPLCNTYEEAVEAACIYSLKNLI